MIQVYITSACRAYRLADHYRRRAPTWRSAACTSRRCPEEAARARRHDLPRARARTPGRPSWPTSARGRPQPRLPLAASARWPALPPHPPRPIKRHLYLVPNSIVVSRGCPHVCDFCYKEAFFEGGRGFYTQTRRRRAGRDRAAARPPPLLPRRPPLRRRALRLRALRRHARHGPAVAGGGHRATPCCSRGLLEKAVACGPAQPVRRLRDAQRRQPARAAQAPEPAPRLRGGRAPPARPGRDGQRQLRLRHGRGRRVASSSARWSGRSAQGIETATFHILTPYPGTALYQRMEAQGRHPAPRLGPLRHAPRGLPHARHDARTSSRPATGAPTATSTAGAPSCAGAAAQADAAAAGCATSPTPRAGRSSSRCGTGSSARARRPRCCRCSRRC